MKTTNVFATLIPLALLSACSPVVPPELADARRAYSQAQQGPAAQLAPADLHKARESLDQAERAFNDDPRAQRTRDLAYVAERKSEEAGALGQREAAHQSRLASERQYGATQGALLGQARGDLQQSQAQLQQQQLQLQQDQQQLGSEQQARTAAEQRAAAAEMRAKDVQEQLAKLALVKQDDRGMVITLSGSVLFASNQAVLLPEAQTRLDQVAQALLATKEKKLVIAGYTDSRGKDSYNLDLSRRRAEAVRSYIVSRGYEADLVSAEGMGPANPVADNTSAEGRANNRRVEIVVKNKGD
jgi:outer membrane protein OmpA-like peptidoglycan-associated protein